MKRLFSLGSLFAVLALAVVFATVPGCPETKKPPPPPTPSGKGDGGGDGGEKKKAEPLAVKAYDGVVKGKVTLEGKAPDMPDIDTKGHADTAACHVPKKQDWIVSKSGGVANVVVFLEAPAGKFLAVDEKLVKEYKNAWIDQPLCVYEPHVVALFAAFKGPDGKNKETGLKLDVKNSGKLSHNTKIKGETKFNPEFGKNLNPGTDEMYPITYQKTPIDISCDKHNWMGAKLITFDHPFFAVTDKDGNFEIKNVPTDVEVTVKTWHEVAPAESTTKTFKKGDNELDLKIKAAS